MAKFQMLPTVTAHARRITARIADAKGQDLGDADKFKLVKLVGDSQYGLCADGNPIEGFLVSTEGIKQDEFALGTVQTNERFIAVSDAALTIGDNVVAGAPAPRGTPLKHPGPVVKKSTTPTKWRCVANTGKTADGKFISTIEYTG